MLQQTTQHPIPTLTRSHCARRSAGSRAPYRPLSPLLPPLYRSIVPVEASEGGSRLDPGSSTASGSTPAASGAACAAALLAMLPTAALLLLLLGAAAGTA